MRFLESRESSFLVATQSEWEHAITIAQDSEDDLKASVLLLCGLAFSLKFEADANMRAMRKLLARADEMDRRVTAIEDRVPVSSQ